MLPQDSFLRSAHGDFSKFVADELRPSTEFNQLLGEGIAAVAKFLHHQTRYSVKEVVKGGSAGKGTTVKGKSDVDVVIFLNDFRNAGDFRQKIAQVISDLKQALSQFGRHEGHSITGLKSTRFSVQFALKAKGMAQAVDIDLLPAFDNLGVRGKAQTYQDMLHASDDDKEYYSASLSPLQIDFIKTRATLVKDLIRLVKYWRKTHFEVRLSSGSLPSSYPLELIVIRCWENAGRPQSFNLAKGLKVVLETLANNTAIDMTWGDNYNIHSFHAAITGLRGEANRKRIPFILDPASPFRNTAARFGAWGEVAQVARESADSPCLRNISSYRQSWA